MDISILHNIQVNKIHFDMSCTSVTNSIVSEVRQTLFILCIMYLHLVAYFYRCGILQSPTPPCLSLLPHNGQDCIKAVREGEVCDKIS